MTLPVSVLVVGLLALPLAAWLVYRLALWRARAEHAERYAAMRDKIGADAVRGSRSAITGRVAEQMAPLLPGFGFNPRDARFIGNPVDYVVFDGLCEGALRRIVFVEVKTGGSLNGNERQVRAVVEAGAVEWMKHQLLSRRADGERG